MTVHNLSLSLVPCTGDLRGEADHRIANSLQTISSLVRLRARRADKVDPAVFLREIADRIDTIGHLHRLLAHSSGDKLELAAYLGEICGRLSRALSEGHVSIAFECAPDIVLPAAKAMPIGLIAAELISNSIKYAHPAGLPIKIALRCGFDEKGDLRIAYDDDGVGFPEEFDFSSNSHLGMRFIRSLAESLGAAPEWRSDSLGVRFETLIPLAAPVAQMA